MITEKILKKIKQQGPIHFALLDPDKQTPKKAGILAKIAEKRKGIVDLRA